MTTPCWSVSRSAFACMIALSVAALPRAAQGQSLFLRGPQAGPAGAPAADPALAIHEVSLISVRPPQPVVPKLHDLVTIIINESSKQEADQSLDTSKDAEISAKLNEIIDLHKLLELELAHAGITDFTAVDAEASRDYQGEGDYERSDKFTDRITAEVIDVKPNGVLVLEARRVIRMDTESKTVVVSGRCRSEDITRQGTVQSNQLADLVLVVDHEGELDKAASKGWLTRAFEAAFPF